MSEIAQTIKDLVVKRDSARLKVVLDDITHSIAGAYDPDYASVRTVVVEAAVQGLVDPDIEVLVNAVKDGGETADAALGIIRGRHAATIHYLACRSGIDYRVSDAQITEGLWEAARRYDNDVAKNSGAKFHSYAHPWMKKLSRPRPETKPGRLDKPFSYWVEDYASRSSTDESSSNYSRLDHFFEAYGLTVEEDHGRSMDIRDQLASLPRDMQRVVKLNIYESRSLPETSEMTGFTLWEVRKLLKEAKAILRVGLRDYC